MVLADVAVQRRGNVRLVTAVENMELIEVGEHSQRSLAVPSVADGLEVVVGSAMSPYGFLASTKKRTSR